MHTPYDFRVRRDFGLGFNADKVSQKFTLSIAYGPMEPVKKIGALCTNVNVRK